MVTTVILSLVTLTATSSSGGMANTCVCGVPWVLGTVSAWNYIPHCLHKESMHEQLLLPPLAVKGVPSICCTFGAKTVNLHGQLSRRLNTSGEHRQSFYSQGLWAHNFENSRFLINLFLERKNEWMMDHKRKVLGKQEHDPSKCMVNKQWDVKGWWLITKELQALWLVSPGSSPNRSTSTLGSGILPTAFTCKRSLLPMDLFFLRPFPVEEMESTVTLGAFHQPRAGSRHSLCLA